MNFWENFKKKELIVGAHRGVRSLRPENTLSAFAKTIEIACDYVELDVSFSSDGIAIIIHDNTLNRTSDVECFAQFNKPYLVSDYRYEDLKKLDFGSWFLKNDPFGTIKDKTVSKEELLLLEGEKIVTLDEALYFFKKNNFPVNIEIKDLSGTSCEKNAVKKVLDLVQKHNMENLVIISSFNHDYLQEIYSLNCNIQRAVLQEKEHPKNILKYLKKLKIKNYNISFRYCL